MPRWVERIKAASKKGTEQKSHYFERTILMDDKELNDQGDYPQDTEPNEYRYFSPHWLNAMAEGLTKGAKKHPGETWHDIPAKEHLARAMRHIILWQIGDRKELHLVNASMRLMMAYEVDRREHDEH